MDRRLFLASLAHTAAMAATLRVWPAHATLSPERPRLVLMILRGGLDGLHAVPPLSDPHYARIRGEHAFTHGGAQRALPLDADFGLHPLLTEIHARYHQKQALIVHAVASPYRARSHFDAQDVLESGRTKAHDGEDGWLNRTLASMPAASGDERGMALGASLPLVLRGAAPVGNWSPSLLPAPDEEFLERVTRLYEQDRAMAATLARARELHDGTDPSMARGAAGALRPLVKAAARFLSAADGPSVAVLDIGGWDSHAGQFNASAQLARSMRQLDGGLADLRSELGETWQRTVVVVCTEFGRTVAINGSGGTDHGTAGTAFVLGGPVAGGRVLGRWPGLSPASLHEGRDLAPTTDLRALFKSVLHEHWKVPRERLDNVVFPGSRSVAPLAGVLI